jgi:hypothetical protein
MKVVLLWIFILMPFLIFAQETEKKFQVAPVASLRMYWMSTNYPATYKDDYALGTSLYLGAKLNYTKNLELKIGYRMFADVWSSNLGKRDPVSGGGNRYEVGLFDLQNPDDKFFGKLETLSISYAKENWGFDTGRMGINTDWVNAQNGRLAPTSVEGMKVWFSTQSKWKLSAWGIAKMSVRGTSRWLGVGESIGVFPVARGIDGKPSQYAGNTQSDWIGIVEVDKKWDDLDLHISNTLVQNISTTGWAELQKTWIGEKTSNQWLVGIQGGFQAGIGNGGNGDELFQYKNPNDRNWALSTRLGYSISKWQFNLNYTKIGGIGRWLSPREWGKDAWYTFIPRERNEGNKAIDALVGYVEYHFTKANLVAFAHVGVHWLPDISDPLANKYNFPSYRQLNIGLKYKLHYLKIVDAQFLVMNKEHIGKTLLKPNQEYNKVGMLHVNVILNWNLN